MRGRQEAIFVSTWLHLKTLWGCWWKNSLLDCLEWKVVKVCLGLTIVQVCCVASHKIADEL